MKKVINIIAIIIIVILTICLINEKKYSNFDVNKDGEVNALDLLLVQKEILNRGSDK